MEDWRSHKFLGHSSTKIPSNGRFGQQILKTVLSTRVEEDIVKIPWHLYYTDMTDQWLTADRCSSSSFVPRLARAGSRAEKIQPQLYLNIYNALSVGSRAAQFGTSGLLRASHLQLQRTDILFKTQTFNFGKQILGWDGGWEFILRVKFIWGEREVSEPGRGTIKMIYLAPHEYSQCISLLGTKSINIKMVNYVANVTADPHLESLFLNSRNFYLAVQTMSTSLNGALLNLRQ